MLSQQCACEIRVSLERRINDDVVFAFDIPIERIDRQENTSVPVVLVVKG